MIRNIVGYRTGRIVARKASAYVVAGVALAMGAATAQAVPELQIYIEGAVYDSVSETWVLAPSDPLDMLRLWTIGNVDGPGGAGAIEDVRLAIAYDSGLTPTFTFTPGTTNGFGGWIDPTTPSAPTYLQTVTDGSAPLLGDGSPLPSHGIYGAGTDWQEFSLGDFTEITSSIADVIDIFPVPVGLGGHINVYELSLAGTPVGSALHFDLYNSILASGHAKFAPFSHDGAALVPLPGATVLAVIGFGCVGFVRRRLQ
ncbi:MAG: choice-of-anchor N protein [Planctomycetes bacterium]|nr:choice-of-anchor N protein [Planctomycetota bacterium]